jgi:hypothetical protein
MCLKYVEQERSQRGTGFKAVRKVSDGVYKPYFAFFLKSCGGGTLVGHTDAPPNMREMVTKTQVTYIVNEYTRVRHKRIAHAHNNQLYTAGIHLWPDEMYAKERFRALKILDDDPNLVLVKFRWSIPLARDADIIVVSRAMPVVEVNVEEEHEV